MAGPLDIAGRFKRLIDYAAWLLEQIRSNNSVAVHFENQNALLYGMTEITRKLNQFEHLQGEMQKANQLMNLTVLELKVATEKIDELKRRIERLETMLDERSLQNNS